MLTLLIVLALLGAATSIAVFVTGATLEIGKVIVFLAITLLLVSTIVGVVRGRLRA